MNMELIGKALGVCPVMDGSGRYGLSVRGNGSFVWVFAPNTDWTKQCSESDAAARMTAAWLAWLIGRGCTLDGWGVTLPGGTNRIRENGILESLAAAVIAVKEAQ